LLKPPLAKHKPLNNSDLVEKQAILIKNNLIFKLKLHFAIVVFALKKEDSWFQK
jgi:hypothetical protein